MIMTGNLAYVVVELDGDNDIAAIWGPFDLEEEAAAWQGMPNKHADHTYKTKSLHQAPEWQTEWGSDE